MAPRRRLLVLYRLRDNGSSLAGDGIEGEWPTTFDGRPLSHGASLQVGSGGLPRFRCGSVGLRTTVIVCDFHPDLTSILASARERLPHIVLTATGDNNGLEIDPCLSDEIGPLVVCENGNLELVVIRGVVHWESKLLVPGRSTSAMVVGRGGGGAVEGGVVSGILPFGRLAATNVCCCLPGFLSQSCRTIGILLANRFSVGQVLGSIDDGDEGADVWAVDGHVGKDARGVSTLDGVRLGFGCHDGRLLLLSVPAVTARCKGAGRCDCKAWSGW